MKGRNDQDKKTPHIDFPLPPEMLDRIFSFLESKDSLNASLTNKSSSKMTDQILRNKFKFKFGSELPADINPKIRYLENLKEEKRERELFVMYSLHEGIDACSEILFAHNMWSECALYGYSFDTFIDAVKRLKDSLCKIE